MGSTSNALDKGGANFKKLYDASNVTKRNRNGQTGSGLYSLFIPMEWNYEGYIDTYGFPVFDTPEKPVKSIDGTTIEIGVISHWENEVEGLKDDQDGLNELYRQFPRTEKHAFRDEAKQSLFNLTKIYEQIDYNEDLRTHKHPSHKVSFQWENGDKRYKSCFCSQTTMAGFLVSWIPPVNLQNKYIIKNGIRYPGNDHTGAFGCDPVMISLAQ